MWRGVLAAAQGAFQADIWSLLWPGVGHAEQVVGDVRVPGVELGGEQLAEGGECLALAAEVGLALPRLAVVGLAVVLKQGLQGVARGAHLGVEVLALGLVLLQQLLVGVRFLPELDLLVVVVQLPGALPLPDELLGLGLHQVQLVGDGRVGARPLPHLLRQLHQHQLLLVLSLEVVVLALVDGLGSVLQKRSIRRFVITEKAPTRAYSWLKAATTAFTFKTLLRHYANQPGRPL